MINYYPTEFIHDGESIGIFERSMFLPDDEHTHSFYSLLFITEGEGRHIIDQGNHSLAPGMFFFIDRSVPHRIEPLSEIKYTEIILTPDFFGKDGNETENALRRIFYTEQEYQPAVNLNDDEFKIILPLLRFTLHESERRVGEFRTILRLYISLIAQYLSRAVERARSDIANRDPAYVISVTLEYVDKHFTENISQEELAGRFGYNSAYFSRMFKKHQGENLSDYITAKRVELAARLLEETELSAEQISERVGYKSKPQFYNTFTKYTNTTPRQYRIDAKGKI